MDFPNIVPNLAVILFCAEAMQLHVVTVTNDIYFFHQGNPLLDQP